MLRLRVNDKWALLQKNLYWQEGLYYRSKSFKDSLNIDSGLRNGIPVPNPSLSLT